VGIAILRWAVSCREAETTFAAVFSELGQAAEQREVALGGSEERLTPFFRRRPFVLLLAAFSPAFHLLC
jgi:hypothetical protein